MHLDRFRRCQSCSMHNCQHNSTSAKIACVKPRVNWAKDIMYAKGTKQERLCGDRKEGNRGGGKGEEKGCWAETGKAQN